MSTRKLAVVLIMLLGILVLDLSFSFWSIPIMTDFLRLSSNKNQQELLLAPQKLEAVNALVVPVPQGFWNNCEGFLEKTDPQRIGLYAEICENYESIRKFNHVTWKSPDLIEPWTIPLSDGKIALLVQTPVGLSEDGRNYIFSGNFSKLDLRKIRAFVRTAKAAEIDIRFGKAKWWGVKEPPLKFALSTFGLYIEQGNGDLFWETMCLLHSLTYGCK